MVPTRIDIFPLHIAELYLDGRDKFGFAARDLLLDDRRDVRVVESVDEGQRDGGRARWAWLEGVAWGGVHTQDHGARLHGGQRVRRPHALVVAPRYARRDRDLLPEPCPVVYAVFDLEVALRM